MPLLGEFKEKSVEVFLTFVEICGAVAAIVLAALALGLAVTDNPCALKGIKNDTVLPDFDGAVNGSDDKCFVMSESHMICCGRDDGNVYINAGVLQLSAIVLLILMVRLIVTVWRCCEVKREQPSMPGQNLKQAINAGL